MKEGDAWETQIYFLSVLSEHLAREQLLGYLADNKLNICGEKKKLTLIYCSLIARRSTTKLYKIANG